MPTTTPLRELLRNARVRVARSRTLPYAGRRAPRHLRLHRRLVQSAASTFGAQLPLAHDLRAVALDKRSPSALRIDDRHPGCYLDTPLGEGAVTISKAVHRPPNRGNSRSDYNQPPQFLHFCLAKPMRTKLPTGNWSDKRLRQVEHLKRLTIRNGIPSEAARRTPPDTSPMSPFPHKNPSAIVPVNSSANAKNARLLSGDIVFCMKRLSEPLA